MKIISSEPHLRPAKKKLITAADFILFEPQKKNNSPSAVFILISDLTHVTEFDKKKKKNHSIV